MPLREPIRVRTPTGGSGRQDFGSGRGGRRVGQVRTEVTGSSGRQGVEHPGGRLVGLPVMLEDTFGRR